MKEKKVNTWLDYFWLGVAIIMVYKFIDNFGQVGQFLSNITNILMPFILGVLIAYILYIPCRKIERKLKKSKKRFLNRRAKGLAVLITYLILFIVLIIVINVILPQIIKSITELINNMPVYYNALIDLINNSSINSDIVKENANEIVKKLFSSDLLKYISIDNITGYIKQVINVASGIFNLFITIIISIYALLERDKILNFFDKLSYSLFKEKTYLSISKYLKKTNITFFNFISGQFIDAVIIGIAITIAMCILKVKYAALLGLMIGIFNLIPFFGAIIGIAIAIIITMATGGISKAIWLAVVVIIIQQIDANIINPKIIGDKLQISPILVTLSVTLIGAYFGVLGMFLAVPIIAMIKILIIDYMEYKLEQKE